MDDQHLLDLLWARSEDALSALAQQFGSRLYQTAINILGDHQDAEEAVNDTYLALWNAIPPERPDPLGGYVYRADLSAILPIADKCAIRPHVSSIDHAVRVAIDEKGVTAAAFTWIPAAGAAPPPETEINFVLDRPFLFVVESRDGLPVFAGIVNTP